RDVPQVQAHARCLEQIRRAARNARYWLLARRVLKFCSEEELLLGRKQIGRVDLGHWLAAPHRLPSEVDVQPLEIASYFGGNLRRPCLVDLYGAHSADVRLQHAHLG